MATSRGSRTRSRFLRGARGTVESGAPGKALRVTGGNLHVGWLSLFGGNSAADAHVLLRLTAAVIGVELARDVASTRERRYDFWEALLAGAFHDAATAREDAAARGIAPAASYLTVALEAEGAGEEGRPADPGGLRALVTEAFRCADSDVGLLESGVALLVFIPAARAVDASNAKTAASLLPKTAARRMPQVRISGGVGTVEALLALSRSADAAKAALAIGRRVARKRPSRVVRRARCLSAPLRGRRRAAAARLRIGSVDAVAALRR